MSFLHGIRLYIYDELQTLMKILQLSKVQQNTDCIKKKVNMETY